MISNVVNQKHLVKLIRKAVKDTLIWQRTEETEYIASSHWAVKVGSSAGTDVRAELFKAFAREAQPGDSLMFRTGRFSDNGADVTRLFYSTGSATAALTPIIVKGDGKDVDKRLVRISGGLAAIAAEYADLTNVAEARATNATSPIFFGDDDGCEILILPIRIEGGWASKVAEHLNVPSLAIHGGDAS